MRPGSLGKPRRGVGRLALETGAPVVPVAVIGTEAIRRGWRIRPHKVRIRAGRRASLPAGRGSLARARRRRHRADLAVRDAPVGVARRTAADPPRRDRRGRHLGHEPRGLPGPRRLRGRAWLPHGRAGGRARRSRENAAYLPGVQLPDSVRVMRASELELGGHDLVCLAVPARALPSVLAAHGERIPRRAGSARALQGPRPAARHAALGVRRRALRRPRGCRARGPLARRRGARARRLGRARRRSIEASRASSATPWVRPASMSRSPPT